MNTETVEREIIQMLEDKLNAFQALVTHQKQVAEHAELEQTAKSQALRTSGQMSGQRYRQYLASIKANKNMIERDTYNTARALLEHHQHRITAALQHPRAEVAHDASTSSPTTTGSSSGSTVRDNVNR